MEYPVSLALFDFVPVALSGAAVILLARRSGAEVPRVAAPALIGAVLVLCGGLAKAAWKLIIAASGTDVGWLDDLLFPLLGTGFLLVAWGVLSWRKGRVALLWPFIAAWAVAVAGALAWQVTKPLLGLTIAGGLAVSVYCLLQARRQGDLLATILVGLQILGFLVLGRLAAVPEQTIASQWIEEVSNTIIGLLFLGAVIRITSSRRVAGDANSREVVNHG